MSVSITHITLNTGRAHRSPRSEVADDVIEAFDPVLDAGRGRIAKLPWLLRISQEGKRALFDVQVEGRDGLVVAGWVCGCEEHSAAHWGAAIGVARDLGIAHTPERPKAPWLAVLAFPGVVEMGWEEAGMLFDFERCLAWAMLERWGW